MGRFFAVLALLQLFFLCSCSDSSSPRKEAFETRFQMKIAHAPFSARVAVSDVEKARGLMNVESLPENEGMLFAYDFPARASFWMKNTLIPLDIAFIDRSLKILEIKKMYPHNLDTVTSASSDVVYALEMNAGWFEKNGIATGAVMDKTLFEKALAARKKK